MTIRDELIELETRFWEAAGDPGFYRERFADDGVMAFHIGLMNKDEVVAAMAGAAEWERYELDDVRLVELADGVASLTYLAAAVSAGSDEAYRAAITSVYARRDDEWTLVVHQQSPLAT